MMSDAIEMAGLKVASLDDDTIAKLKKVLPEAGSSHNPVDVLGDATGATVRQGDRRAACERLDRRPCGGI